MSITVSAPTQTGRAPSYLTGPHDGAVRPPAAALRAGDRAGGGWGAGHTGLRRRHGFGGAGDEPLSGGERDVPARWAAAEGGRRDSPAGAGAVARADRRAGRRRLLPGRAG